MGQAETDLDMDLMFSKLVVKIEKDSVGVWHGDKLLHRVDDVARVRVW